MPWAQWQLLEWVRRHLGPAHRSHPGRRPVDDARRSEVDRLLERVAAWGPGRADVRGLAVVGSWARGDAHADSDVDLVVLTDDLDAYVKGDEWIADAIGEPASAIATRHWGALTERRFRCPSGLEVDFGVASPRWADSSPLDAGTARVVASGLRIIYDPESRLAALLAGVHGSG